MMIVVDYVSEVTIFIYTLFVVMDSGMPSNECNSDDTE
jgi:hypothetical protein